MTKVVLHVLNGGEFPSDLNKTFIALIPRKQAPMHVYGFRPIILCNVTYKHISKVLVNRLKLILPSIVSKSQSTFVPSRLISDNVLIAYEIFIFCNKKELGRRAICPLN